MPTKLNALTGLRFFAAALIVVHHLKDVGLSRTLFEGWPIDVGVSFFFMLSGFIMTFAHPNLDGPGARSKFWVKRIARLWPLHIATIALLLLFLGGDLHTSNLKLLSNLTLTHAWLTSSKMFFSLNSPSWSISTEFFFYLSFPWLLRNLETTWLWKLLGSLAVAFLSIAVAAWADLPTYTGLNWNITTTSLVYISPLARIFEFVTGMCLALAFRSLYTRARFGMGIGTIVELSAIGLFLLNAAWNYRIANWIGANFGAVAADWSSHGIAMLPATALLILAMALNLGYASQIIGSRLGVFLGEISFAIYMLHYVLIIGYVAHRHQFDGWTGAEKLTAFLIILFVGSWALWQFVEKPGRRIIVAAFAYKPISAARYWIKDGPVEKVTA